MISIQNFPLPKRSRIILYSHPDAFLAHERSGISAESREGREGEAGDLGIRWSRVTSDGGDNGAEEEEVVVVVVMENNNVEVSGEGR